VLAGHKIISSLFGASHLNSKKMIWHKIDKIKPVAVQSGSWDGLRSDPVLVCTKIGKCYVAIMYEGTMDGSEFCSFYDDRDFEVINIEFWAEIDLPF